MHIFIYFLLPIITGLIGWGTNYIAVRMIFRPRNEIKIGKIRILGLIPKRRHEIAIKIADTIEKELISYNDIKKVVESEEFQAHIEEHIKKRIEGLIEKNSGINTFITLFMGSSVKDKLVDNIMSGLRSEIEEIVNSLFNVLEEKLDFRKVVREKIDSFDLVKLENIIYSIASRELRTIEILGGVIGFIIGVIQVILIIISENAYAI